MSYYARKLIELIALDAGYHGALITHLLQLFSAELLNLN